MGYSNSSLHNLTRRKKMNKIARSFLAAIGASIIVICVTLAFSKALEEKGRIHASVVDALTGRQLAHASVQIVETKQSAFTNDSGFVTINRVATGSYTVVARSAGYTHQSINNVQIQSGKTTELTFRLNSGNDTTDVVALTPGIIADANNSGYTIHGSRGAGSAERLSGIETSKSFGNSSMSKFALSEIQVAAGDYYAPAQMPRDFNTAEYKSIVENEYKDVRHDPLSTFSIDVDGASYSNLRHFITSGQIPPKDAVRIEEMVNYFKYSYPQPKDQHPFSITTELTECPWNKEHKLALIGLQGKEIPKDEAPAANLTFLIDVSGSMDSPERLPLIQRAFRLLVNELRPQDKVALVAYAGTPGLVLPPTPGSRKDMILEALDRLEAGGSTAGGAGIQLAYKVAEENFDKEKNNRVILATDGDFNVGISSTSELVSYIEKKRETGIYLTTIGVGTDNYKDARMKELADKGNGNYYYIDNILEAKKVFVTQMGGTLNTIAKDVKIQIEFNPAQVKGYRLIGYESRILAKEDFNNDKKDAGELGSGHTVTALYEIIPPGASGDELHTVDSLKYQTNTNPRTDYAAGEVMTVKFRYKKPSDSTSILIEHPVTQSASHFENASNNFRFAASVAEFGMLVRDSKFKGASKLNDALALARSAKGEDFEGYRAEFIKLIEAYQLMDKASR
jgi:Ca-activated chloride channel family protein